MKISKLPENGTIIIATIWEGVDWDKFNLLASELTTKLNVKFTEKVDDFDSKYWHFNFHNTDFVLHYHELSGDVEIYTDQENGRNKLNVLCPISIQMHQQKI